MNVRKNKILISVILALLLCSILSITAMTTDTETTEGTFDPNVTSAENTNFAWSLDTAEGSATKGTLTFSFNNNDTQLYWDSREAQAEEYEIYKNFLAWKEVWNSRVTRIVVTGFPDNMVRVQNGISFFSNWKELVSVRIELVDNNKSWNFRNFWMSGGWFQNCPKLTTVSIGGSETAGVADLSGWETYYRNFNNMFKDCSAVTKVILPTALADEAAGGTSATAAGIHDYMFLGTSSLNSITIPEWAASIGTGAFSGNTSLQSITIPGTVKSIGTSAFSSVTVSNVAYDACTALTNVVIQDGVETIGSNAFKNCTSLAGTSFTVGDEAEDGTQTTATGLVIPASVTTISAGAFSGTDITALKLMGTDTALEAGALPEGAVVYCPSNEQAEALTASGYTAVPYAETVSSGSQLLPSDDTVTMYSWKLDTEGVLTITGEGYDITNDNTRTAFKTWREGIDNSLVKKIVITGSTEWGKVACQHFTNILSNWPNLETIHLGSCIRTLDNGWTGTGIFQNNPKLTTVYSDNAPEYNAVGNINLAGLGEITHDGTKKLITPKMFYNDGAFTSITLPGWLTAIGESAFYGCTNLTYLEIPATVTSIGAAAFSGTGITNIKIMGTDTANFTMGAAAFDDASSVKAGVYSEEMKTLLVDTYGFTADNVSVIAGGSFAGGTLTWELTGGVLTITGSGTALTYGEEITAATLSNIPWSAYSADIEKVVVRAEVTSVCDYAFAGLTNCTSIELPASLTDFSAASVFSGSAALSSVYVTGFAAEDGIIDLFYATSVSADLFEGCNIDATVYLPKLTDTSFLDAWSEDIAALTIATYPTSVLATELRARTDIELAYLPESHDAALARSGATTVGNIFDWTYDDATETVKVSGSLFVDKTNNAEWYAWRDVWADAIVHFRLDKNITTLYCNNGYIFNGLKNLVSVHFETENNIYLRNFAYGYGFFRNCSSLTTISMGADDTVDGVIDLSRWTTSQHQFVGIFEGCTSITKVILPRNLSNKDGSNAKIDTLISEDMFNGCTSLREIVIPDCFVGIGAEAFKDCSALERIVILNPDFSLSTADAASFPANENLVIYVTSESVKSGIEALGIADFTIHNVGSAISAEDIKIRLTDYNGLRGIFAFDKSENDAVTALGLTLKEYGAIICSASEYDYWGGIELENVNGVYTPKSPSMKKLTVFDGSKYIGKTLNRADIENADPDKTYFAATVVNYNNNFKSDLYMTGYVVYTDDAGNDYYAYANCGDIKADYEFVNLYQMTLDMYKNDETTNITSSVADEVAVWNTILQGAIEGYSEVKTSTEGVTVTIVTDSTENYAFVRNENGVALTEDEITAAMAEVAFDGTIAATFGAAIADKGTTPPTEAAPTTLNPTVTTPNRYNRDEDKAQHQQGMCSDGEHIYYSFTGKIVKVRMSDGVEVGTVTVTDDINQYSAHMGNLAYHNGKIYGSLIFWGSDKIYIAVMNADDIVGDVTTDIMQAVYYADDAQITLFEGSENEAVDIMHGGSGLDSITVGKLPGGGFILPDGSEIEDNEEYLVFGAGSAYQHPTKRHDDDYLRLRFVDFDDVASNAAPLNSARIAREETTIRTKYTAYAYAGSTMPQCIAYDKDTGDYHFATYGRDAGLDDTYPKYDYFAVDGTQKLRLTELYFGQNTPEDSEVYDISIERAAQYKDTADLDGDGDTGEQMLGWTMNLKCVCGRDDIYAHDAIDYDNSGYAGRICGMAHPGMADQGLISMGNDYFYVASADDTTIDGVTYYGSKAILYRLRRYNGAWTFTKVSS